MDAIIVGHQGARAGLSENAQAVINCIYQACSERSGPAPLAVVGVGRGAVSSRYGLAKLEYRKMQHETACYVSSDGAAPSGEEQELLDGVGGWPQLPKLAKAVSRGFTDALNDRDFDETVVGDPARRAR